MGTSRARVCVRWLGVWTRGVLGREGFSSNLFLDSQNKRNPTCVWGSCRSRICMDYRERTSLRGTLKYFKEKNNKWRQHLSESAQRSAMPSEGQSKPRRWAALETVECLIRKGDSLFWNELTGFCTMECSFYKKVYSLCIICDLDFL